MGSYSPTYSPTRKLLFPGFSCIMNRLATQLERKDQQIEVSQGFYREQTRAVSRAILEHTSWRSGMRLILLTLLVAAPVAAQQADDTTEGRLKTGRRGYCISLAVDTVNGQLVARATPCVEKYFDLDEWTRPLAKTGFEGMGAAPPAAPVRQREFGATGEVAERFHRLALLETECDKRCDAETHNASYFLWKARSQCVSLDNDTKESEESKRYRWNLGKISPEEFACRRNIDAADAMEELLLLQLERPKGWKQRRKEIKQSQGWIIDCSSNLGAKTARCH